MASGGRTGEGVVGRRAFGPEANRERRASKRWHLPKDKPGLAFHGLT
jgi:hypothetical protein